MKKTILILSLIIASTLSANAKMSEEKLCQIYKLKLEKYLEVQRDDKYVKRTIKTYENQVKKYCKK